MVFIYLIMFVSPLPTVKDVLMSLNLGDGAQEPHAYRIAEPYTNLSRWWPLIQLRFGHQR